MENPIKMDDLGVFSLFLETSISTSEGILVDKFSLIHSLKGRFFHTQMFEPWDPPTSSSQLLLAPALLQDSSAPRKTETLPSRRTHRTGNKEKNHTKKELLHLHFISKNLWKMEYLHSVQFWNWKKKLFHSTLKVVGQSLCPTFALSFFHRPQKVPSLGPNDFELLAAWCPWPPKLVAWSKLEVCSIWGLFMIQFGPMWTNSRSSKADLNSKVVNGLLLQEMFMNFLYWWKTPNHLKIVY